MTIEQSLSLVAAIGHLDAARKQLADAEAKADTAQMRVSQWERAVEEHEARLAKLRLEVGE